MHRSLASRAAVLGVILILASAAVSAQTLADAVTGENVADRCGTTIGTGDLRGFGIFGGCSIQPRPIAGAPGWSGGTGRVEVWDAGSVYRSIEGDASGDLYGWAVSSTGNLDGGPNDYVAGAPGASGSRGYVRATSLGRCGSSAPPLFSTLWTVYGGAAGDRFGHAVATIDDIDGDGRDDVLVGAPYRHTINIVIGNIADAGAVFVYSGNTGALIRAHFGGTVSGLLGYSVAALDDLDGDGIRDYAVGEPGYDVATPTGTLNQAGRVRVYSGATGTAISALWTNGPKGGASYGWSVAAAGDVNLDGVQDYVAGAPDYDQGSLVAILDTGHVEVRSGASGAMLFQMNGPAGSRLGEAVTGGFDLLEDGYPELLVGGSAYDSGRGVARVISMRRQSTYYEVIGGPGEELGASVAMSAGYWKVGTPGRLSDRGGWRTYEGLVRWSIEGPFSLWGSSVAVLDDVDGDGWDDLAVAQYDPGTSFVASTWEIRSGRTAAVLYGFSNGAVHGHTVALIGDLDGDGVRDIAHAQPHEGIVEIRSGDSPNTIMRQHGGPIGSLYGHVVADAGDVNGDGTPDYLIGEPKRSFHGNPDAGRVLLYSGSSGSLIRTHSGTANDELGYAVAGLGDVDGDGHDDYGAGAPFEDAFVTPLAGAAYVWSGFDGSLIWSAVGTHAGGQLGHSLCGPGDVDRDGLADFAVGEPFWGPGGVGDDGRVRVFAGGPAGAAHGVLHTFAGFATDAHSGWAMAAVGDVDRDGIGDFAYTSPKFAPTAVGGVDVVSGATGRVLHIVHTSAAYEDRLGLAVAGRAGAHADGRQEVVVGAPKASSPGHVRVIFLPEAASQQLGTGCGSMAADQPLLTMTTPTIGRIGTLATSFFPATSTLPVLVVSAPVASPILLGFGCEIWLDEATASIAATNLPRAGALPFFVEENVALAGISLSFQAIALDNNAPLSLVLSNGVEITLGF